MMARMQSTGGEKHIIVYVCVNENAMGLKNNGHVYGARHAGMN